MKRKYNNNLVRIPKNNESIPKRLKKFFDKPRDYEGGVSQIALPGSIIPRVIRDTEVPCPCMWASDPYLDPQGRPRIDAAFQLAVGVIDGVIRIEAGNEKIPIYDYLDIDNIVVGARYYKSLEVFTGDLDQDRSATIQKHLGDTDTPYYPGLAYFVLKGIKLWRWPNKNIPALRAVILRNVEAYSSDPDDLYDPAGPRDLDQNYNTLSAIYYDGCIMCLLPGSPYGVRCYDIETDTWSVELAFSGSGSAIGGDNAFAIDQNNVLYATNGAEIFKRESAGSWTDISIPGGAILPVGGISHDGTDLLCAANNRVLYKWLGGTSWTSAHAVGQTFPNTPTCIHSVEGETYVGCAGSNILWKWVNGELLETEYNSGVVSLGIYSLSSDTSGNILIGHRRNVFYELTIQTFDGSSFNTYTMNSTDFINAYPYAIYFFDGRIHFCTDDRPNVYRLETDLTTFTKLSDPGYSTSVDARTIVKGLLSGYLYCGTSNGLYTVGES